MNTDLTPPTSSADTGHPAWRSVPPHFTAQQRAVVVAVRDSGRHLMIRATAGSGKTTTLTEAAWHAGPRSVYFVYNRHATAGVASRLPPGLPARTLHAHGLGLLYRGHQPGRAQEPGQPGGVKRVLDLQPTKTARLLGAPQDGQGPALLPAAVTAADRVCLRAVLSALTRAWDTCREQMLDPADPEDLAFLSALSGWPSPDAHPHVTPPLRTVLGPGSSAALLRGALAHLPDLSAAAYRQSGLIDHTDMLWLPLHLGLGRGAVRTALVDEAQDLTPLRQAFVRHVTGLRSKQPGRVILCGDPEQAIYAYAGADPQGLARMARELGAQEWPLSVSFRCARAVVGAARTVSDFITAAPGAPRGAVEHLSAAALEVRPGEAVLCRLNAPLLRLALDLLARGVRVHLTGRDLAGRLLEVAEAALPPTFTRQQADDGLSAYLHRQLEPLNRTGQPSARAQRAAQDLRDLCRCALLLARRVTRHGPARQDDLRALLARLYAPPSASGDAGAVTLSTVHRAKGLEWTHVTVLHPELMPLGGGDPQEERCVQFVAFTRARHTLRLAYGAEAWAQGLRVPTGPDPGRDAADEPPRLSASPAVPAGRPGRRALTQRPAAPPGWQPPTLTARTDGTPTWVAPDVPEAALSAEAVKVSAAHEALLQAALRASQRAPALPDPPPPLTLPDNRDWPLFGGPDLLDAPDLRARLTALAGDARVTLSEWATLSLTRLERALASHGTTGDGLARTARIGDMPAGDAPPGDAGTVRVRVQAATLRTLESAAGRARRAVPAFRRPAGDSVRVVVMEGGVAREVFGTLLQAGPRVISVEMAGETRRFHARTGELLNTPFQPLGTHLPGPTLAALRPAD
ncbi:UvrD-helicase domain-containing protein [Deinococcus sp.]|uniref:UvrD-helicase domain-containing protein n=1 Tax=Deinococcus sp. TaxID=47478 RepID=UPI0025C6065D|nr:UvrD-helicase domain-containing protein [Deinococcus sp.]